MPHILPLQSFRAQHGAVAGGKGAALGELIAAGVPVPPGFVVTTHAFRHAAATLPEPTAIAITPLPHELQAAIRRAYKALATPFVAVRSSATAEDGAAHAWAGQLESFVPTAKTALIANVQRCWASLYSPRATAYRAQAGLADTDVAVAVVVQALIDSEHAGIAFSTHPVTGNTNHIVIEAVHGLGEAAVGGHVTPDTYVLHKQNNAVLEYYPGGQTKQLVRDRGQAQWHNIPPQAGKIAPKTLQQLAGHVRHIEQHFGRPMDIEWTCKSGAVYIVQSRPITTL